MKISGLKLDKSRTPAEFVPYSTEDLNQAAAILREAQKTGEATLVDIEGYDEEITAFLEDFGFHHLAIEDVVSPAYESPRLTDYDDFKFLVQPYFIIVDEGEVRLENLFLFFKSSFILSLHRTEVPKKRGVPTPLPTLIPGILFELHLLHYILDMTIDGYAGAMERMLAKNDELEATVFKKRLSTERYLEDVLNMRQSLLAMERSMSQANDSIIAFERLCASEYQDSIDAIRVHFADLHDHFSKYLGEIENERELLVNLMEIHLSLVSNKTNEIVRILTIISVVVLPLNFLAGFYGMNFAALPGLQHPYGPWILILVMISISTSLLFFFKRRGWV